MKLATRAARLDDHDYAAWVGFWHALGLEDEPPAIERWREHIAPSTLFLEAPDGRLAAYGLSFPFGARGDVRQIAVDPAFRKQGIGRQIMEAVRARLIAAGCRDWRLEVKADNAAAVALYHAVGMRVLHPLHVLHIGAAEATRFAATRSGKHEAVTPDPADDAALEANLDLGAGQITRWRTFRGHCPLVRVGMTGLTQIWRDFEPDLWLLFPFCAPDADVAATLISAALPIVQPLEIQLGDPPARDALLAAGATPFQELLEMGGPL